MTETPRSHRNPIRTHARAFVESSAMAWLIACVCSGDHRLRCTDDRPTPLREMDPPQLAINSGRGGHPRHPGGQTHHQWSNCCQELSMGV